MRNSKMTLHMKLHDLIAFNEVPNKDLLSKELSLYMEREAIPEELSINILRNKEFKTGCRKNEK